MIDTIAFDLCPSSFRIVRPDLFCPNAKVLDKKPDELWDTRIFPRSVFNNSKDKYYPKVSLYEHTQTGERRIYLKVECSVSKLLKGENFFSLPSNAREKFASVMAETLRVMGVETTEESILSAPVNKLHIAHNMLIPVSVQMVLADLYRTLQRADMDIQKTDYRNGGSILHFHYDSYELAFYDKVADMEHLQHCPKRAVCCDKYPEIPVYKQYLEDKLFNVLRMELRMNTPKAIQKFWYPCTENEDTLQKIRIQKLSVGDCFNIQPIKDVLVGEWNKLEQKVCQLPVFRRSPTDLYEEIVHRNSDVTDKKRNLLIPVVMMLASESVVSVRQTLEKQYGKEKAKRIIKEALSLDIPRYKPNYVAYIGKELKKFTPLTSEKLTKKVKKSIIKLNMDNVKFLTVDEMASILKVVPTTIYRYLGAGKLPAYKFGKEYRVDEKDFKAFIASRKVKVKKGGRK